MLLTVTTEGKKKEEKKKVKEVVTLRYKVTEDSIH